jgi:integrase
MPRTAQPYLSRGWFVTNLGGKRHRLCREADGLRAAGDALRLLQKEVAENGGRPFPNLTVVELIAMFLDSVKVERSHHTYSDYQRWLTEFARTYGNRPARDITRYEAQQFRNGIANGTWVRIPPPPKPTTSKQIKGANPASDDRPVSKPYKPKTVDHAVISVKRCWNWGIENEVIPPKNPFDKLPLFDPDGRQRVMTNQEFQSLLRHSWDSCFQRALIALRYTSARPGEVRKLTWAQVDWENHRWVIYRHKSSHTAKVSKPKLIPMCACVENLLRWLKKKDGHQPFVFLNSEGNPWTKDAFVQRMDSLRARAGIVADENGEKLVLYHHRHTFLTAAASSQGISGPMLQQLAGHTDPRTTERYAHLANKEMYQAGVRVAEGLRPQRPGK